MERKLANFRALRQARALIREDFALSDSETNAKVPSTITPQNENVSQTNSRRKDYCDWILDSKWGRWLATRNLHNITLLKVLLWVVLLGFFVELDFGLPFFVVSLFYWLYEGLRDSDKREPGEMSAYSVFNPGCQALLGTLTAEQMEAEMGFRVANR
ncbi:SAYSvFN domain-containing protein 1 [Corythoichthys intestinalis]|uniref:SAYSvFN domain-containing protein 1 n=1 Tax=Corythoichthys intestinalis TaxID=161448 RepID=UPI0025A5E7F1|nr:SAYSvFN domain-containing protein 1 [Corythoichthys intestinalis]XP_061806762.1 SAYSvFN domain-containing protein 1-like [Nerophis lumbriciformis]